MTAHLKRVEPPSTEPCGARPPGERPGLDAHRLACVLPGGHQGEHRDALRRTWEAPRARAERKPVRMCVRCHHITDTPMVVSEIHSASGPGFTVYCCPTCAPYYFAHPERQPGWPGNPDGKL
ncbi:hypothetical protein BJP40_09360 [Streptomyces sp. CC53]|nr:hypothetical protein BJP40_09360 [Streptomyces sp. CC53]